MGHVIRLSDGSAHAILDERDALRLVGERMGWEMEMWLRDRFRESNDGTVTIASLEKEAEALRARHREAMLALRRQSESIAAMVRGKNIERKALSAAAGVIGRITWREINR